MYKNAIPLNYLLIVMVKHPYSLFYANILLELYKATNKNEQYHQGCICSLYICQPEGQALIVM